MILLFLALLLLLLSLFSFYMHYKTVNKKRLNINTQGMIGRATRKKRRPAIRRRVESL